MISSTSVIFLNAGQGDSTLVRFRSGKIFIIDSNRDSNHRPAALKYLKRWFAETNCADVEFLCLTHPDADHYRGMAEIIQWVWDNGGKIKYLLRSPFPSGPDLADVLDARGKQLMRTDPKAAIKGNRNEREFDRLRVLLDQVASRTQDAGGDWHRGYGFSKPYSPDETAGAPAQLKSIAPTTRICDQYTKSLVADFANAVLSGDDLDADSTNAISCVLWFSIGVNHILLPGDATKEALQDALDFYEATDGSAAKHGVAFHIAKAPHHGAASSSSPELWRRLLLRRASVVISAGGNARVGHPHAETLDHIRQAKREATLYCTSMCHEHMKDLHRMPLAIRSALLDSRAQTRRREGFAAADNAYNGDCCFDIPAAAGPKPLPECSPIRRCKRHEGLE